LFSKIKKLFDYFLMRTPTRTLADLLDEVTEWSFDTFGSHEERGSVGPLQHLIKETYEAERNPGDISEVADMLILFLDALWRSKEGLDLDDLADEALVRYCLAIINRTRTNNPNLTDFGMIRVVVQSFGFLPDRHFFCFLLSSLVMQQIKSGRTPEEVLDAAFAKMEVNRNRKYPERTPENANEPIEHLREEEESKAA
jgi:hypothetical protein